MLVLKFGGSSVADAQRISSVSDIVSKSFENRTRGFVVVSALKGITDELLELAELASNADQSWMQRLDSVCLRHLDILKEILPVVSQSSALAHIKSTFNELEDLLRGIEILREASLRTKDLILSFGERASAYLLTQVLLAKGINARFVDARKVLIATSDFGNARVIADKSHALAVEEFYDEKVTYVVTGFIGSTEKGETVSFGRGGSDYTASVIADLVNAKEIEIWTDVDGFLTADPRKVPQALPLNQLSFEEAMELCHFGARVIYPPTLQPANRKKIPITIKNSFNPDFAGTKILYSKVHHKSAITGVTSVPKVSLLRLEGNGMIGVSGVSKRLFTALASIKANVILITQASSEQSISVAVSPSDAFKARSVLVQEFDHEIRVGSIKPVLIEDYLSIISVVGENMRHVPGVAGKVFSALGKQGVNIIAIAQGSSELSISFVVANRDEVKALRSIHDSFFLSESITAHVALVGPGLIGKTFLKQLAVHAAALRKSLFLEIKLVAVADSKKMLISADGLSPEQAYSELAQNGTSYSLPSLIGEISRLNLPSMVVVDCSASEEVASLYSEFISNSISVVTPNKKAQSSNYADYLAIKSMAARKRVPWLYETSVGAGLPVISTLNDLIRSGDKIHRIEGVLSGTLSYIFSTFKSDLNFSTLVKGAKEAGYTEPDPRDDLNGMDVARKILILAREAGLQAELDQVQIENLVPEQLRTVASADEFLKGLEKFDTDFKSRVKKAEDANKKLRFIAKCDFSQNPVLLKVGLEEVDSNSPFWSLEGTDNMVAFVSDRYNNRPLVVRGPGAGAEVTAAGVFADLIRAVN
jgi:aspartokinase/homoserine dehydrogenase 1